MGKVENTIKNLIARRERVLSGKYNCIPFPFPRFQKWLPGIEKGKYVVITANQKIGKSKFSDYIFIYEPLIFMLNHPELKIKILYFTLEMSAEEKHNEFLSHLLYKLDGLEISPTDLKSTDRKKPVSARVIELLESERYQKYIAAYENMVEYIDDERNPTGINKRCREFAEAHGTMHYKEVTNINKTTKVQSKRTILDHYEPEDPEQHIVIMLDNAANLNNENRMTKRETIDRMSKYFIILKNQFTFSCVLIQHQAQAQEGIENAKMGKLKPSSDGLADCKTTTRDANLVLGLYSPFKYGIKEYAGYDIMQFKNNIRFLEVIEDRDYGANGQICPLYFDGAVSTFAELPKALDAEGISKFYKLIEKNRMLKENASTAAPEIPKNFLMFAYLKRIFKGK